MYLFFKRFLDVLLSVLMLFFLFPLFLILALAIKLDSRGPILFTQWRVGKGHKLFKIYKLRTMYVQDAFDGYDDFFEDDDFAIQKEKDPRVTRTGAWLRKFSFDELPQLVNIIKGEMSLIGPRPLILYEMNRMPKIALKRLNVRPGLTGFAQAEGRSEADIIDRLSKDIYYAENIKFNVDCRIIMGTIKTILSHEGAI